jgi:hypothetical protein
MPLRRGGDTTQGYHLFVGRPEQRNPRRAVQRARRVVESRCPTNLAASDGPRQRSTQSLGIHAVPTPRGPVEVLRQQTRGLRGGTGWRWSLMTRRCVEVLAGPPRGGLARMTRGSLPFRADSSPRPRAAARRAASTSRPSIVWPWPPTVRARVSADARAHRSDRDARTTKPGRLQENVARKRLEAARLVVSRLSASPISSIVPWRTLSTPRLGPAGARYQEFRPS